MKRLLFTLSFILTTLIPALAQVTVTGRVTDADGESLPGVSVVIKGTQKGTVTDLDGNYSISNVTKEDVLVFSFLGMLPEEITVGEQVQINLTMVEDIQNLDEVVVVGYGSVKRENLAGSVTDINAKELSDIPVANLSSALEGRLAGVSVQISSGNPGATNIIKVRENSSYSSFAPEGVLYVIDGIERTQDDFEQLDPSEVESISVLKDASASVYGAKSAGGVIVVNTKRGKEGKTRVSYNGSLGITQAINTTEMLSAYEHASMLNDGYVIQKLKSKDPRWFTEDELTYFRDSIPDGGYNWMDGVWRNATVTKHNLNVSGGTENIKYFVGGNYSVYNGCIDDLYVKRYTLRSNIDVKMTKRLSSSIELSFGNKDYNTPFNASDQSSTLLESTFAALLQNPKWIPPTINGLPVYQDGSIVNNPYVMFESGSYKRNITNSMNYIVSLKYDIPIEGLSAKIQFSQSKSTGRGTTYNAIAKGYNFQQESGFHIFNLNAELDSATPYIPLQGQEYLEKSVETDKSYQANINLSYKRKFGPHDISALAECEFSEGYGERVGWKKATDQVIEGYDLVWAFQDNTGGYSILSTNPSQSADLGYIGRLNYVYGDRYIIELACRYETNINFPTSHRWAFFPSVLAGWVISEEPFFKNATKYVNFLKLRGSVGRLGNAVSQGFTYELVYQPNVNNYYLFGDTPQLSVEAKNAAFVNEDITWQKTNFYNGGIDARFFDSKLSLTADGFYKYTFDILAPISSTLPTTVGVPSNSKVSFNYGIMHAYGYELELGYHGNFGSDFKYDVSGLFSWAEAKKIKVAQSPAAVGSWYDETKNYIDNQPGMISSGIVRTNEELADILMDNPNYTIDGDQLEEGMLNYVDLRGTDGSEGPNGVFNNDQLEDRTTIADHTSPTYHYGVSFGVSWKGIKVKANLVGEFGHKLFYDKEAMTSPTVTSNVPAFWANHWTPENTNATYPRAYKYGGEGQYSTFWMVKGHTLRLSDLNVSYTLPSAWTKAIKVDMCRIYFNSKYLWTIINPFDYKDAYQSNYNSYPMTRDFIFGINIGF